MSSVRDQQLIVYCLKQGLLSMSQVRRILSSKSRNKSILKLIARELGWNKAQAAEVLKAARQQSQPVSHSEVTQGQKFGKYILLSKIGAGGMGAVYKAYHPELDAYFALKTILPGHVDSNIIKRFKREARLAAQLRHPHIVQVYDVGLEAEQHYIVMEFIDGQNLSDLLKGKKLWPHKSLKIILKIAQALAYAHSKNIVHRDIKPSNIIIANHDDTAAYLMDFGLAACLQQHNSHLTHSGQLLGTPQYMSPEQAQGKARLLDGRSDIYSLGTVLYEMLTGRPVVRGGSAAVLQRVIYEEPVPPSKCNVSISRELEAIILKCLAKDPPRRYQTADELVADIERYLRGEAVLARSPGVLYRLWRKVLRHGKLALLIGGLVFLMVLIAIWGLQQRKEIQVQQLVQRAKQLQQQHDFKGAANMYRSILEYDPHHDLARQELERMQSHLLAMANELRRRHKFRQAMESYRALADLAPMSQATEALKAIQRDIDKTLAKGRELAMDKSRLPEALQICRRVLQWYPEYGPALKLQAHIIEAQRRCRKKARKFYDQAMEIFWNPRLQESEIVRCQHYFEQALSEDPAFADAHFQAGRAAQRLFHNDQAITHYRAALRLSPGLTAARYYLTALSLPRLDGNPDVPFIRQVEQAFARIWGRSKISLKNTDIYSLMAQAQVLLSELRFLRYNSNLRETYQKIWQRCRQYCQRVIQNAPNFADAYFIRAQLYSYLLLPRTNAAPDVAITSNPLDLEQALQDCAQGIYLDPLRMEGYLLQGAIYKSIGAYSLAEHSYTKALLLKNVFKRHLYHNRATCYIAMGEFAKALVDLNRVIKELAKQLARPDPYGIYAEAFLWRMTLKIMHNDKRGAEKDLQNFLRIQRFLAVRRYEGFFKALGYAHIDSKPDRALQGCREFMATNRVVLEQIQFIFAAQGEIAQDCIALIRQLPNIFCISPRLKRIRQQILPVLRVVTQVTPQTVGNIANSPYNEFAVFSRAYQATLQQHPRSRARQEVLNKVIHASYPPLTMDLLIAFMGYLSEQKHLNNLVRMTVLPTAQLYYRRAALYYLQGKLEAAQQDLQAALKMQPDFMPAHYGLSTLYALRSEQDTDLRSRAYYHLKRAIETGWRHWSEYTLQDQDFQALELKKASKDLHQWDKVRQINQQHWEYLQETIQELNQRREYLQSLRLLYLYRPLIRASIHYLPFRELFNTTRQHVFQQFRQQLQTSTPQERNQLVRTLDRQVKQFLGEQGQIEWEWVKKHQSILNNGK